MRRVILALALLLAPAQALAEACSFTTDGNWASATSFSGTNDCTGGDPTADDVVTIDSGVTVTLTGSVTQTGAGGVVVNGTLQGDIESIGSATVFTYGTGQIVVGSTGTFDLDGAYRQLNASGSTLQADPSGFMQAGTVIPCPGWDDSDDQWEADCGGALVDTNDQAGANDEMGLVYLHSIYDQADGEQGDQFVIDDLAELAVGDMLCWFDPDRSTPQAPSNDPYCYEITDVDDAHDDATAAVGFIIFDIEGTDPDDRVTASNEYPLARRQVKVSTLHSGGGAMTKGDRWVAANDDLISSDNDLVGRHVRFEDGSGQPQNYAYLISQSIDNADCDATGGLNAACPADLSDATVDLFRIAQMHGALADYSTGDDFWIDYGMRRGEPFRVILPFEVTMATNPSGTGGEESNTYQIDCDGTCTYDAVLFNGVEGFKSATGTQVYRNVWMRDLCSVDNFLTDTGGPGDTNYTFDRVAKTGGCESTDAPASWNHWFSVTGSQFEPPVYLDTVGVRHHQDDVFFNNPDDEWRPYVSRLRSEFVGDDASSSDFVAEGTPAGDIRGVYKDLICIDCISSDAQVVRFKGSPQTFENLISIGYMSVGAVDAVAPIKGLLAINSTGSLPIEMDHFVVRDVASNFFDATDKSYVWRDGLLYNISTTADPMIGSNSGASASSFDFQNVALIDVRAPSEVNHLFDINAGSDDPRYRLVDITVGWSEGTDPLIKRLFRVRDTAANLATTVTETNGLLFYNFANTTATSPQTVRMDQSGAEDEMFTGDRGPCFLNSQPGSALVAGAGGSIANMPSSLIRDVMPDFEGMDTELDRFKVAANFAQDGIADECGAGRKRRAGQLERTWGHYVLDLEPLFVGPDLSPEVKRCPYPGCAYPGGNQP